MSSGHSIAKRRTNEDEVRGYPVNRLCALAGVTRQAFYKRDNDLLFRRLALEQFVVQYILEIRKKDPINVYLQRQTKATVTIPEQTTCLISNH